MRPQTIARNQIDAATAVSRRSCVSHELIVIDTPLVETEWDMVRAFARHLEREDVRLRFGYPLDPDDEAVLRPIFDIRVGVGEMVWALDETAAVAAVAHRISVSQTEAEIGLIVRSDLKHLGIGECLLRAVLARAARQGLKTLHASVLWENRPMLRLAAKIGYAAGTPSAGTVELTFVTDRITAWLAECL